MEKDIEVARALQKRVDEIGGGMWAPFDSGRYAYHTGIPLADDPYINDHGTKDDPKAASDWARGWLYEAERKE